MEEWSWREAGPDESYTLADGSVDRGVFNWDVVKWGGGSVDNQGGGGVDGGGPGDV